MRTKNSRPGFSLVEILVVMGLMLVVFMMMGVSIRGIFRLEKADANAFERMAAQTDLAEQFRQDVTHARSAPKSLNKFQAGPNCLILQLPDGNHTVYEWNGKILERSEWKGGKSAKSLIPLGANEPIVEFHHDNTNLHLLTLKITEPRGKIPVPTHHAMEISAALGGDLQ